MKLFRAKFLEFPEGICFRGEENLWETIPSKRLYVINFSPNFRRQKIDKIGLR